MVQLMVNKNLPPVYLYLSFKSDFVVEELFINDSEGIESKSKNGSQPGNQNVLS